VGALVKSVKICLVVFCVTVFGYLAYDQFFLGTRGHALSKSLVKGALHRSIQAQAGIVGPGDSEDMSTFDWMPARDRELFAKGVGDLKRTDPTFRLRMKSEYVGKKWSSDVPIENLFETRRAGSWRLGWTGTDYRRKSAGQTGSRGFE
jgi:hypothetical protein